MGKTLGIETWLSLLLFVSTTLLAIAAFVIVKEPATLSNVVILNEKITVNNNTPIILTAVIIGVTLFFIFVYLLTINLKRGYTYTWGDNVFLIFCITIVVLSIVAIFYFSYVLFKILIGIIFGLSILGIILVIYLDVTRKNYSDVEFSNLSKPNTYPNNTNNPNSVTLTTSQAALIIQPITQDLMSQTILR